MKQEEDERRRVCTAEQLTLYFKNKGETGFTLKWFLGKNQHGSRIYLIYLNIPD